MAKVKTQKREFGTEKNFIPNYDNIFNEENGRPKKKTRFFSKILKLNAPSIALSLFIFLFQAAPVYITPIVTANVIDIVTEIVKNGISDVLTKRLIINAIILIVAIIQNVPSTMLRFKVSHKALRRTSAGIRSSLVRKLQSLSLTYYKKMENGRIQSKYIKDTDSVDGLFTQIVDGVSLSLISVIVATAISIYKNRIVALFFLVVVPINVLTVFAFRKKMKKGYSDYRHKTEDMSNRLNTMVDMMQVTKSHGLEQVEYENVNKSITDLAKSGLKVDRTVAGFGSAVWVANTLLSAINLLFCSYLAIKGRISVGDIVLFGSMYSQISGNITGLVNSMPGLASGVEALNSISEVMNITEIEVNIGKIAVPEVDGNIVFDNVSYSYPDSDSYVIKDFSLSVKKGECIAVVGASGSGKSTLMNMIIGFLKPTKGTVYIDGKSIDDLDLPKYRNKISVVPQNSILFSGSIKENITYGLDHYTEEDILSAVDKANVTEFVKDLPLGLDTRIGEHGEMLSGGQKQRISIARALIRDPRILILDEATSALDNISEYHVQKAISKSIEGRTTFIVAHRLSTIRNADRIIVMDKGECVESGTYQELMDKKGKFYELKNLSDINMKVAENELGIE